MSLTLIPPFSIWGDKIIPTLETAPPIGYHPFNAIHLNPQPDLPLTPNSASDCLPRAPSRNYSFPPIDTTVLMPILSWSDPATFNEILPVFLCTILFLNP